MKKIVRLTESDLIKLVKKVIKEQNPPNQQTPQSSSNSSLTNDVKGYLATEKKQNITRRVGDDLFNKLDSLAKTKGMTFDSSQNDGTYFKWTKKLVNKYDSNANDLLVLVVYNSQYEPKYGGVTTYIDRDGGNAIKISTGQLLKGTPNNGTYPDMRSLDQIGLDFDTNSIISRLTENINNYLSQFGLS